MHGSVTIINYADHFTLNENGRRAVNFARLTNEATGQNFDFDENDNDSDPI